MPSLTVICPVYNEEYVIRLFYEALKKTLDAVRGYQCEVLFVVDRSKDKTLEILRDIAANDGNVKVLSLSSRFGHQMSIVAGIDHAQTDLLIMMDSDLQHPPELIPKMLSQYEEGYEVVHALRKWPADKSKVKKLASKAFYQILNRFSEVKIESGAADFRLISRRVADVFRSKIREQNQFLRGLFRWVGFRQVNIEFVPAARASGMTKYDWSRLLKFAMSGITSFSRKPLQYAIGLGLLAATFGLVFGIFAIVSYFFTDQMPSGWATLATIISFLGGIQLIFLGVLGEYVGAIFDEVKRRPLYVVEESINIE